MLTLFITLLGRTVLSQEIPKPITLEESIRIALDRNLNLHSAKEGALGAEFTRESARTNYYGALSDFNFTKAMLERSMGRR